MDVDETGAKGAEERQLDRRIVDKGAAFTRRRNLATNQEVIVIVNVAIVEQRL